MATVLHEPVDGMLRTLLDGAAEPVLVVGPSPDVIEALVEVAIGMDEPSELRLLAAEPTVKDVVEDFIVASNAADLVEDGALSIRTTPTGPGNELVLTEERLSALVTAGDETAALSTDDAGFVDTAYRFYSEAWGDAEAFRLRTPPLSRVRRTLREEIGPEVEADFTAVLGSLDTARGNGDGLDEVTISLLVAARNEELLYDISKWGEDVGIASKATFSRTKTALEELGLIDTEKVPIDVGRPRLRLKFARDELGEASADELASVAQSLIA